MQEVIAKLRELPPDEANRIVALDKARRAKLLTSRTTATPSQKRGSQIRLPVKNEAEMQRFSDKFQAQVEAKIANSK